MTHPESPAPRASPEEQDAISHPASVLPPQEPPQPASDHRKPLLEDKLGGAHENLLPLKKLIPCLLACALCLFCGFCDQTGVTVALPHIAESLHAQNSINWAGTSSLLANTVSQVLFGRFADIFGRKQMLIFSLTLLTISNLLCGFATVGPEFYVFRAMAGIGSGGISSLAMVIVSDVVTLKQRGKYQGILGTFVGMGNSLGPVIMGAFAQKSTWRNFYRVMPPIMFFTILVVYFFVHTPGNKKLDSVLTIKSRLKTIDYLGMFLATAALILLLIPISGGGSTYPWNSALVIAMFVVGGVLLIIFFVVECTIPKLPMIPLTIFKNRSLSLVMLSSFLFGIVYYSFLFSVPYYFQLIRGYSPMRSSVLLLPLVIPQSMMSTVAGCLISLIGHYFPIMAAGFAFWLTGQGLTLGFHQHSSDSYIIGALFVMGTGVGFIFQPSMVAAQANSKKAQRAVVIGTRNVIRSFGGALGISCSSLIISNSILREINSNYDTSPLPSSFLSYLKNNIYTLPDITSLNAEQLAFVRGMYMQALRHYFYFTVPLIGVCFVLNFFIKDNGLQCLDECKPKDPVPSDSEKDMSSESAETK